MNIFFKCFVQNRSYEAAYEVISDCNSCNFMFPSGMTKELLEKYIFNENKQKESFAKEIS